MLNIFILGNLHSYLIEFYIVKWKTLEQLQGISMAQQNRLPLQGFFVLWGLSLVFLRITGTLPWK